MNCPECKSANVERVSDLSRCQDCGHYFQPPAESIRAGMDAPPASIPVQAARDVEAGNHRERIRNRAENFTMIAAIFVVIGILAFLAFGFSFSSGDAPSWTALDVFCGCVGAALWLYLIAQIIHIRANTEK